MYRVGYIDDEPTQFENYKRSLRRRCKELDLVLIDDCESKQDILDKIYEKQIDVLLIDYKMVKNYGFNGTTLINYINDSMRDIQCFIMTAVDTEQITDGLVADRDKFSKNISSCAVGFQLISLVSFDKGIIMPFGKMVCS